MTLLDSSPTIANSSPVVVPPGRPLQGSDASLAICRTSHDTPQYLDSCRGQMWFSLRETRVWGGAVSRDPDFSSIVDLLSDTHARTILKATNVEPCSASELAERCDASDQTIYRRLERLEEAGLVADKTRVRDDGHHDTVYTARLENVSITLREGEFEFTIEHTHSDSVDELTDLWRRF